MGIKLVHPDAYHGKRKRNNYFEGWYYKIVDVTNQYVFAFIPGIIRNKQDRHAFIQVLDGRTGQMHYIRFDTENFSAKTKTLDVSVGNSHFTLNGFSIDYEDDTIRIQGSFKFKEGLTWPDSLINPGSMGFYNYLTFMECYSQVCLLTGRLEGSLRLNNDVIDFTNGNIYIEKNWGRSFPKAYIWIQSNSFHEPNVTFTCSLGRIPFRIFEFSGFLVALKINDHVYTFTTMNRSKMTVKQIDQNVSLTFTKKHLTLEVTTLCKEDEFINIKGPLDGKMAVEVKETMMSKIKILLRNNKTNSIIYSGIGKASGIELMGDLTSI